MKVNSYAKINWTLDVLYKREDGFHELRTIYQTVSLHDTLHLTPTNGAISVACDNPEIPCDESNLVYKAALKLREAAKTDAGAQIFIEKRIPTGGGMGGGSSNAAVTLMALQRLWQVEIDDRDLFRIAAELGSDVPLFLIGGTVLGIGRGEEVYPLEDAQCEHLLLVNPRISVSTAEAYRNLSRLTRPQAPLIIHFTFFAAKEIARLPLTARNDFENSVLLTHPLIAEGKQMLYGLGARHALMSGSGATIFGVFDNLQTSEQARDAMRRAGYWAECARTINRSEYQATIFSDND
jgi:4-diphosphocytidyl-2-C-methyl-D-erythritol kinase